MKTDKELGHLPREEYRQRLESLQQSVNPKPYTKEEMEKKKHELRELNR